MTTAGLPVRVPPPPATARAMIGTKANAHDRTGARLPFRAFFDLPLFTRVASARAHPGRELALARRLDLQCLVHRRVRQHARLAVPARPGPSRRAVSPTWYRRAEPAGPDHRRPPGSGLCALDRAHAARRRALSL